MTESLYLLAYLQGTLRLIDSGDYLSTSVSPQQQHQPVTTSTMLQYLQPSSNAIQNMLIQQILTSPEQVQKRHHRLVRCEQILTIVLSRSMTIRSTLAYLSFIGTSTVNTSAFSSSLAIVGRTRQISSWRHSIVAVVFASEDNQQKTTTHIGRQTGRENERKEEN